MSKHRKVGCGTMPRCPERIAAGFWIRSAALGLDTVITAVGCGVIRISIGLICLLGGWEDPCILFRFTVTDISCYLFTTGYFVFLTGLFGCTLGKKAMGIEVIRIDNGEKTGFWLALYRETVGRYLTAICCVGYLYAAADAEKRGFHDLLSGTKVVLRQHS